MHAEVAELATELEASLLVQADFRDSVVHQRAVMSCHHVAAQTRVDGGWKKQLTSDVTLPKTECGCLHGGVK